MTPNGNREYGTPNSIVWHYFACLRRLARECHAATDPDRQRESAALTIFMAVSAVEAFLNIWFRTSSEAGAVALHRDTIMADLKGRSGLLYKFKAWPAMCFRKGFALDRTPARDFLALVDQRNALVHFTTNYDTIEAPGIKVEGLVDITAYTSLGPEDADNALRVSEDILREFFRLQGLDAVDGLKQIHYWTARVPSSAELADANRRSNSG
jgi:hypothetical protein